MFGQTQQQQPQQSSGFSFGGSSAPKPALSFGNTTNNTTTPSFGLGASTNSSTPAASGTGFSLGGNSTTSTTTPSTGGFSFGAKPAAAPATTGGFSLGTKPAAPATTGGFSFGAKPAAPATTGSLFGGSATTQPTQPATTGLFGQSQQQNQQMQPFQQQQQQQPQTQSFNSQPSFPWSASTNNTNSFTQQQQQPQQPQQQQYQTINNSFNQSNHVNSDYTPTINDKLIKIKSAWDSNNPQSTMVTHLYNKVDSSFSDFTRPLNETPEEWENAMKNRPKEYNSIPVKCNGFTGLFERNSLQDNHVKQTRLLLNEINDKLSKLNEKHDLHSNALLLKCKMRQRNSNIKLLKIAINLSILKYKGYPLTNDEEMLISKFKSLLAKLDDPIGLSRVNELWARLTNLRDKYPDNKSLTQSLNKIDASAGDNSNDDEIDENSDVIKKLLKILAKQQHGIQFLCELMQEDEAKLIKLAQ